jgi:hypothetical protein
MPFRLICLLLAVVSGAFGMLPQATAQVSAPPTSVKPPAGQQAALELGRTTLPINEYFTIALRLRGARLERYSAFPDIEGFKKSGKSSTTTTVIVNGKASEELVITQRYAAYGEGEFVLKPFVMTVNGQEVRSAGATIHVEPQATPTAPPAGGGAKQPTQPLQGIGLLDELFGKPKPQAYVEPRDNAFLAIVPDKAQVWVGEPVHVGLYFYLAPSDQGLLDFYRFAEQLPDLLRGMRQPTAWEELFDETDILPDSVNIKGKPYLRYRLHEAVYYPLNTQPLTFPAIGLQMLKYKVAKQPVAGADNRLGTFKVYFTQPRTVQVRALPPHAGGVVPVGRYRLLDGIDRTTFRTGQSIRYTLTVEGEGNLTALTPPIPQLPPGLELYGPEIQQVITRQSGRVGGRKVMRYRLIARQPGTYNLGKVLPLPVFDFATGRYDTLRSGLSLTVRGAASRPQTEATAFIRTDPFYAQQLPAADNTLQDIDTPQRVRRYAYLVLAVLMALAVIGWWQAGRKH